MFFFICLKGRESNRCGIPRGRALGGSSVIYFMVHTRGNKNDFDRWSQAGNYGWSYDEVLPYFLKSERANLGRYNDSPYHNKNGLWSVSFNPYRTPLAVGFIEANKQMGLDEIDYNSHTQMGVGYVQANTLHGRRHSAYRAFIEPILNRQNLHIMINTKVTRILIDPIKKEAYGVEFIRNHKRYRVTARKEVILSSGTFHSPQVLTLSGVGLKEDLQRLDVPQIQNLNVGQNMHDHLVFAEMTFITNRTAPSGVMTYVNSFFQYLQGRGMMTLPAGVEALGFIKTPNFNNESRGDNVPDLELVFAPGSVHLDRGFGIMNGGRMKRDIYDRVYRPLEGTRFQTFLISVMLFHPQARGRVEIKDRSPYSNPKIYSNFFQNDIDVEKILHGVKYVMKLAETEPFKKAGARLHSIPNPYCQHFKFASDDYWRCVIKIMSFSIQHHVGTCKMGPKEDKTSVVSPELKVHGIKYLRVVDTSIVPEAPSAHTNAISVMIGEKASDLIKTDWKRS
jgi:choline dehydrogenase-like flavoprotein